MRFGIVQGRLTESKELQSFPKDWTHEFYNAETIGLDYIELVSDREHNKYNPLWDYTGSNFIEFEAREYPIICNDYIINHSLKEDPAARLWTYRLIEQAQLIGSELIVLPLFEHSFSTDKETLMEVEHYAASNNIRIALETCEDDYPFNIVYDTGNRSQTGVNLAKDIKRLGKKIVHVHIKDKDWQGNNVLLGTGEVNFKEVMQAFKDIGYDGTYTFETVRGKDPIRTAKYNLEFIKFFMAEAQ